MAGYRSLAMKVVPNAVEILQGVMEEEGWRPEDLASASGMSHSTLKKWLSGTSSVFEPRLALALQAAGHDPESYGLKAPRLTAATTTDDEPKWFTAAMADLSKQISDAQAELELQIESVLRAIGRQGAPQ